jgi:peptide/nickel transport system permease protein
MSSFLIGTLIGAIAGFFGRYIDLILMRIVDALLAFPAFLLALAITVMLGNSVVNVGIAVAIAFSPIFIRLTRGEMLKLKTSLYADAARSVGNPQWRIMLIHLLPHALTPAIVQSILTLSWSILTVSALSFIGVGIRPPTPEWGVLAAEGIDHMVSGEWWVFTFPGLVTVFAVYAFNSVGDRIRELMMPGKLLQSF